MPTKIGAPRKWLGTGDTRTLNPAWKEWREARDFTMIARLDDPARYWPEEYGKDLGEGAWIMVVEVPHTALQWDLPLLSIWRARPNWLQSGLAGRHTYQAVIATPAGDLHLWPHEYVVLNDPTSILTDPDVEVHTLGGDPLLDEEALWYLMSRGIPHAQAARLLLPSVRGLDYAYATLPLAAVDALEGFGVPLWRHIQLHPRTPKDRAVTIPPNYSTPRPPSDPWGGYAERMTRFLSDKLREVLGEDTAAWVSVDVDDYSDQIRLIRVRDDARRDLGDESDESDPDYWVAGDFDEDLRLVEGTLDSVLEGLRTWIKKGNGS